MSMWLNSLTLRKRLGAKLRDTAARVRTILARITQIIDARPPVETNKNEPRDATPKTHGRSNNSSAMEGSGEFYFRRTILDQLDNYFRYLRAVKKLDADLYEYHRKVGAFVIPVNAWFSDYDISPWFLETLPANGAFLFNEPHRAEDIENYEIKQGQTCPRFLCFQKYDARYLPQNIERPSGGGACYVVTAFFADVITTKKHAAAIQFGIELLPSGRCQPLRTRISQRVAIRHKKGKRSVSHFYRQKFEFDRHLIEWASQHGENVADYLVQLFCICVSGFENGNRGCVSISAKRGNNTAKFSVDPQRLPYFFRDRDETAAAGTNRKKIFHQVRVHARRVNADRHTYVKTHFRGIRSFNWNGYNINITVPYRDHFALAEVGLSTIDSEAYKGFRKTISLGDAADEIISMQNQQMRRQGLAIPPSNLSADTRRRA